jgi:hypothetical protein
MDNRRIKGNVHPLKGALEQAVGGPIGGARGSARYAAENVK